jgi:LmbE family N-acetylglucosaminyl deacetylase
VKKVSPLRRGARQRVGLRQRVKKLLGRVLGRDAAHRLHLLVHNSMIHNQRPAVWQPEGGRIMVLAPHMDDEVLGCGGTIARHVEAGAEVSVIFLTDGRYGGGASAGLTEAEREGQQQELVAVRQAEARRAGGILGVKNISFLEAEDGRLHSDTRVPKLLQAILERERPQVVYLPSFLENHTDHAAAGDMLMAAAGGSGHDFECRSYEVWTPLFPNIVVEIDPVIGLKWRALECYQSQLALMDYIHTIMGLNAYRASAVGCKTARFVEAFYAVPLADYRRLQRSLSRIL